MRSLRHAPATRSPWGSKPRQLFERQPPSPAENDAGGGDARVVRNAAGDAPVAPPRHATHRMLGGVHQLQRAQVCVRQLRSRVLALDTCPPGVWEKEEEEGDVFGGLALRGCSEPLESTCSGSAQPFLLHARPKTIAAPGFLPPAAVAARPRGRQARPAHPRLETRRPRPYAASLHSRGGKGEWRGAAHASA